MVHIHASRQECTKIQFIATLQESLTEQQNVYPHPFTLLSLQILPENCVMGR